MWEGVLRLVAGSVMGYFTLKDTSKTMARSPAFVDLTLSVIHVVALPMHWNGPHLIFSCIE